jgi:MYXO-CTERM domain-containing protein
MITRSFSVVADVEFGRDMMEIYQLLGDPALRFVKANDSPATSDSGGASGMGGSGNHAGSGGSPNLPGDDLGLAGCSVGGSRPDTGGPLLLMLGALVLAWRRRRRSGGPR